nr:MAG TPA: hypothetical protein [Caudoviricetes sp.]
MLIKVNGTRKTCIFLAITRNSCTFALVDGQVTN